MFKVYEIKNANRRGKDAKKIEPVPLNEMFNRLPEERTVPYFSLVPEQIKKDERFRQLNLHEKGTFLLLCIEMWGTGGMVHNFPRGLADTLGVEELTAVQFRNRFLDSGLLVESDNGCHLVQPELREQYLQFIRAHSKSDLDPDTGPVE